MAQDEERKYWVEEILSFLIHRDYEETTKEHSIPSKRNMIYGGNETI